MCRGFVSDHRNVRQVAAALLVAPLVLLGARSTHASPGAPDATFGGFGSSGQVQLDGTLRAHAVAPDGRIVLAGSSGVALQVMRLLPNGVLDQTFGGGGSVVVTNLQFSYRARAVAVQPDGRIVVVGYTESTPQNLAVARLTTSGNADPTFSGDGFTTVSFSSDNAIGEAVLIQPDGKIVVAGSAIVGGDWDFVAARFNADGTLDNTFNGDGKATIGFGGDDKCFAAALQPDGRIVMVGGNEGSLSLDEDFAVARLNTDGHLDGSFDGDGKKTIGFGGFESAHGVAIEPDGRIVLGGDSGGDGALARLTSSGGLDGTFGPFPGTGKFSISGARMQALVAQPDGRFMALVYNGGSMDVELRRYDSNGLLDTTFGFGDGIVNEPTQGWYNSDEAFNDLTIDADGRLLASVSTSDGQFFLVRLMPDGSRDVIGRQLGAFDDVTFPSGSNEIASGVALQSGGNIVVAGPVSTANYGETDFGVMRFLPDGRRDDAFGVHGRAEVSFSNIDEAKAVAVQPDGKIVVAGYEGTSGSGSGLNFMVARFNVDGSLDPTFGFFGYNIVDFFGTDDYGNALALQADGKIVVAGAVNNGSEFVFGVARFTADGILDNTFDGDGRQTWNFAGGGPTDWATAVVMQGARIVVGGFTNANFALVAFTASGAVDNTFGSAGQTLTEMGGNDYLYGLAVGPDSWIYAAGVRDINGHDVFALAEYDATGVLAHCPTRVCSTIWPGGKTFVDLGGSTNAAAYAIDVRGDGRIVAAGCMGGFAGYAEFIKSNGSPQLYSAVGVSGYDQCMLGVKYYGSNKLVMAGYMTYNEDKNIAVAKYETTNNPTATVPDAIRTPLTIQLEPAAPNPLTSRTLVAFDLPRAAAVRLTIHDVAGRIVRTLAGGVLPAGRHQRVWDGTDERGQRVAPGAYYECLQAAGDRASRSIVVLR
jgi:uncharacterized delta-60 repeat protein